MVKVSPRAMMATKEKLRMTLRRFSAVRKCGEVTANMVHNEISAMNTPKLWILKRFFKITASFLWSLNEKTNLIQSYVQNYSERLSRAGRRDLHTCRVLIEDGA